MDTGEDGVAAMAAAMGFSGFGKAAATKKRKYNSKTDAFIEGDELKNVDRGGKKGQGSGGNEVPLGRMRAPGGKEEEVGENAEEIDLDMDEDTGMGGQVDEDDRPMNERCIDTSCPPPVEEKAANKARRATRRKVVNEDEIMLDMDDDNAEDEPIGAQAEDNTAQESADAQKKIEAIVASQQKENVVPTLVPKQKQKQKPKPAQGLAAFMSALQTPVAPPSIPPPPGTTSAASAIPPAPGTSSLPSRPQPSSIAAPPSSYALSPAGSVAGSQRGARGQRNELWYVDYYDPSFNENPWKQLVKEHGLPEVGSWVERPSRNQRQGQRV